MFLLKLHVEKTHSLAGRTVQVIILLLCQCGSYFLAKHRREKWVIQKLRIWPGQRAANFILIQNSLMQFCLGQKYIMWQSNHVHCACLNSHALCGWQRIAWKDFCHCYLLKLLFSSSWQITFQNNFFYTVQIH